MSSPAAKQPQRFVSIGSGEKVPYPEPTSETATVVGRGNARTGTHPELALRSALHRAGLRYRVDHPIRAGEVRVRPDVVFTRRRIAVFVDGCFWHSCPDHSSTPKSNLDYWGPKLAANVARDRRVDAVLEAHGWVVLRFWEHDDPAGAAETIAAAWMSSRGDAGVR